jgi:uncharacterized phiE125 gp8 family phage protein
MAYSGFKNTDLTEETGLEPITRQEAKEHLRLDFQLGDVENITFSDDDQRIDRLISEARSAIEQLTGLSLIERVVKTVGFFTPGNSAEFPYGPVKRDAAIAVVRDGVVQEEGDSTKGYKLGPGPFPNMWACGSDFEVSYSAGWDPASVPKGLKRAILEQLAFLYENNGAQLTGEVSESAERAAAPFSRNVDGFY